MLDITSQIVLTSDVDFWLPVFCVKVRQTAFIEAYLPQVAQASLDGRHFFDENNPTS